MPPKQAPKAKRNTPRRAPKPPAKKPSANAGAKKPARPPSNTAKPKPKPNPNPRPKPTTAPAPKPPLPGTHCSTCQVFVRGGSRGWESHCQGKSHRQKRAALTPRSLTSQPSRRPPAQPAPSRRPPARFLPSRPRLTRFIVVHAPPIIIQQPRPTPTRSVPHQPRPAQLLLPQPQQAQPSPRPRPQQQPSPRSQPPSQPRSQPQPLQITTSPTIDVLDLGAVDINAPDPLIGLMTLVSPVTSRFVGEKWLGPDSFHPFTLALVSFHPSGRRRFRVTFDPERRLGAFRELVEFTFEDIGNRTVSKVLWLVTAVSGDRGLDQVTPPRTTPDNQEDIPSAADSSQPLAAEEEVSPFDMVPTDINELEVLESIEEILRREGSTLWEKINEIQDHLPQDVDTETHEVLWRVLLCAEETQMMKDLGEYNIKDVFIVDSGPYHLVDIPGVVENLPKVSIGDTILVQVEGSSSSHEGIVYSITHSQISLKLPSDFKVNPNQRCSVSFQLNLLNLQRMHEALSIELDPEEAARVLFPENMHITSRNTILPAQIEATRLELLNESISNDPLQLRAVTSIKEWPVGSIPFVVLGPPGTGKTTVLVEGIQQILLKDPDARILVCAPSISATDLLAKHLQDETPFLLNSPSRPVTDVPENLQALSCIDTLDSEGNEVFGYPSAEELMECQIIVTTCLQSQALHALEIPQGHFTHIFIDEADQALEPEAMVPIKTIVGPLTNIILCGDPRQLGPAVYSEIAAHLGYGETYLHRLVSSEAYCDEESTAVLRLNRNYRSHPAILQFPRGRFYGDGLQTSGDPENINWLSDWSHLPTKGFPIIFHAIKDDTPNTSSSYTNSTEAAMVKHYVGLLHSDQSLDLEINDFGIICPFKEQCLKIKYLVGNGDEELQYDVGPVEDFQGSERKIIIISTVQSDSAQLPFDKKHNLGLLGQEHRFNVAITRSQALLVVIGDPTILGLDPLWRSFLNYIYLNGGWAGASIGWDPRESLHPDPEMTRPAARGFFSGGPHDDGQSDEGEAEDEN